MKTETTNSTIYKLITDDFDPNDLMDYNNKEIFKSMHKAASIEDSTFHPEDPMDLLPSVRVKTLFLNDNLDTRISKFKKGGYLVSFYTQSKKDIRYFYCNNLKTVKEFL